SSLPPADNRTICRKVASRSSLVLSAFPGSTSCSAAIQDPTHRGSVFCAPNKIANPNKAPNPSKPTDVHGTHKNGLSVPIPFSTRTLTLPPEIPNGHLSR